MHKQPLDWMNSSRACIDKNVIPTKSVRQTLRGFSQELNALTENSEHQNDPL